MEWYEVQKKGSQGKQRHIQEKLWVHLITVSGEKASVFINIIDATKLSFQKK